MLVGRYRPHGHIRYLYLAFCRSRRLLSTTEIADALEALEEVEDIQGIDVYIDPPCNGEISDGDSREEDCCDFERLNRHQLLASAELVIHTSKDDQHVEIETIEPEISSPTLGTTTVKDFRRSVTQGLMTMKDVSQKRKTSTTNTSEGGPSKRRKSDYSTIKDVRLGNRGIHWPSFVENRGSNREKNVDIQQPYVVQQYNRFMGGVDRLDANVGTYRIAIRGKKWYSSIIMWMIDVTVNNSTLLARSMGAEVDTLEFRRSISAPCYRSMERQDFTQDQRHCLFFTAIPMSVRKHGADHLIITGQARKCCAVCKKENHQNM
ncbi:unnamed protein product [Parnassius apollo]|uniref:(apollo) hypothetical protein n=1 Tax=Parnassius apollo TaxID=110799 RepID=A0A8S3Y7W2_PARAO|nr:unnamed protein product [Parnassius apollo]